MTIKETKAKSIKVNNVKTAKAKSTAKARPAARKTTSNIKPPTQVVPKVYKKVIVASIVLVVILAGVIIHFSFSQAFVSILPKYNEHDISFSAQIVDPSKSDLNTDEKNYLIGRKLETVISKTAEFNSPKTSTLSDRASSEVTIINNYTKDQILIATTRLLSPDNKLFRIVESVTIPAGEQVKILAKADAEGDEYLIEPTKFIIPGLWDGLQDKIYAESTETMKYQEEKNSLITNEIIDNALVSLRNQIIEQAMAEFEAHSISDEYVNQDALIAKEVRQNISAEAGDNIESFTVELELMIQTITYDEQKLLSKIENDINTLSEQNQGLINFSNDNIIVSIEEKEENTDGIIGDIKGKYKIRLANPNINLEQLKGKTIEQGVGYLNNLSGVESASIKLTPFWLKNIPTLDNHIKIILNK